MAGSMEANGQASIRAVFGNLLGVEEEFAGNWCGGRVKAPDDFAEFLFGMITAKSTRSMIGQVEGRITLKA